MSFISFDHVDRKSPDAPVAGDVHQVRTVYAMDVDEHAHNLTNWEQSYDQITPGRFQGALAELQLPQMQVFRESLSQAVRQSCCVWPETFWFGLVEGAATRINGRLADADKIMVRPGHCEFELVTPADYATYGIVIQRDALVRAADQMGCQIDWTRLTGAQALEVSAASRASCLRTLSALLSQQGICRNLVTCQQELTDLLLTMLDTSAVDGPMSNSFMRRQRIVAKARDYVLGHRDQAVTVPELCERLHVSRRTLQYCFEDVLDISPMQYLRLIRLNGARRHLRENLSNALTVQDVATDWGFWHFSQFSSDYRKLFGCCPSESLHYRPH
ncbi:MAG: AraC family ethanolamine operon transcriptional activator [Rhodoferax sp.]|jgi:AraC family ethanolamine operon transcriptional activator